MNNKIIVKVYVPSLDNSYDAFISINLNIFETTKLIINSINELIDGITIDDQARLYYKDNGEELEIDKIVKDTKLRNGSKLVLL